MKKNKGGPT